jgi:hypothetical protein
MEKFFNGMRSAQLMLMKRMGTTALGFLLAAMALVAACSGANPAAAPAPQIEIPAPAVLKFAGYQDLAVDFSTISPSGGAQIIKHTNADFPVGSWFLPYIEMGPIEFNQFWDQFFKPALDGIQQLEIPVSTSMTMYSARIDFTTTEEFAWLRGTHDVRLDFTPFDYDNDGVDEPCSGNTGALPICVRFWLDEEPFLAGVFDRYLYVNNAKVPDNIGAGRFKMRLRDLQGYGALFAYQYAQTPPVVTTTAQAVLAGQTKSIEYFFRATPAAGSTPTPFSVLMEFSVWDFHTRLIQEGPDGSAFKSLKFDSHAVLLPEAPWNIDYVGQFVEGATPSRWSGSLVSSCVGCTEDVAFTILDLCASLPQGYVVVPEECNSVGGYNIRQGNTDFLAPVQTQDIVCPLDFESPAESFPPC